MWMTAVPLTVLLIFGVIAAGGPKDLMKLMERSLEKMVAWAGTMIS
jgi:hypothetical protein